MWLLIIQLILNFPSLWKTIKEILALIRGLNDDEQKAVYHARLVELLRRGKTMTVSEQNEFETLKKELEEL